MTLLALGLVAFLGIHLVPTAPTLRDSMRARWGEGRYKGVFSLVSLIGFVLIIAGYAMADRGPQLFAPWPMARTIAPYVMVVSFILLAAANMRGHLRRVLEHPMLIGVLLWSGVHLLANGDLRGTVLFGAFFAWGLVDLASAISRGAVKTFVPVPRHDVIAIVGGLVVALIVMVFHRSLFGAQVVSFGV